MKSQHLGHWPEVYTALKTLVPHFHSFQRYGRGRSWARTKRAMDPDTGEGIILFLLVAIGLGVDTVN